MVVGLIVVEISKSHFGFESHAISFQVTLAVVNLLIIDSNCTQMKLVQHYKCIFYVVTNSSIKINHCCIVNDSLSNTKGPDSLRLSSFFCRLSVNKFKFATNLR